MSNPYLCVGARTITDPVATTVSVPFASRDKLYLCQVRNLRASPACEISVFEADQYADRPRHHSFVIQNKRALFANAVKRVVTLRDSVQGLDRLIVQVLENGIKCKVESDMYPAVEFALAKRWFD